MEEMKIKKKCVCVCGQVWSLGWGQCDDITAGVALCENPGEENHRGRRGERMCVCVYVCGR